MFHPHAHEIVPNNAAEAFLSSCESMSIWHGLGFPEIAESHRQAAKRAVDGVSGADAGMLARNVVASPFLRGHEDCEKMLAMLDSRQVEFAPFFLHVLRGSSDPLLQFRAASKIISQHSCPMAEVPDNAAFSPLLKQSKQIVSELGENFESLNGVFRRMQELALSGSFDQNPCIGYLRDQLNLCTGRRGREVIIKGLERGLSSPDPSLRLASTVVLGDCMEQLGIAERVALTFSSVVEQEQNDEVRYYMAEALSTLFRRSFTFSDLGLRARVIDCLLTLRGDEDSGIRSVARVALRG